MDEFQELKNEIEKIKERNARVEADKAWETCLFRKVLVAVLTYIVIVLFFIVAELPKPFINPIVPALGFLLSTLSVSFFKTLWLKWKDKDNLIK